MKDKKPLTYMLGEIDEKYLEEYYERRKSRSKKRTFVRYCSLAASVVLVLGVSIAVLPMMSNRPDNRPADTSGSAVTTAVSDPNNATKPIEKEYKIIYAEANEDDYGLKDIVESESVANAIVPGQVSFAKEGGLYEIMQNDDQYEDCVFAVMISCNLQSITSDNNCADETSNYTFAIGLKTKKVTVVLNGGTDNAKSFDAEIVHLTKKQLSEFEVPDYIGVEFTLIPRWMDADDRIIHRPVLNDSNQTQ